MKMNSNSILCGSASNGIIVTDLPVNVLVAMRDSIDAAIREQKRQPCDKPNYAARPSKIYHEELTKDDYADAIREAIASAERAGYEVCLNDAEWVNRDVDIQLYDNNDDDDDDDDDEDLDEYEDDYEDEEDFPCAECCRDSCRGCRFS